MNGMKYIIKDLKNMKKLRKKKWKFKEKKKKLKKCCKKKNKFLCLIIILKNYLNIKLKKIHKDYMMMLKREKY